MTWYFKVNAVVLLLLLIQVNGDTSSQLKISCPYNSFCTTESMIAIPDDDSSSSPCCMDCFCDEACHFYGDCCPDVDLLRPSHDVTDDVTQKEACVSSSVSSSVPNGYVLVWGSLLNRYRMFDKCPSDFVGDKEIVAKCEEEVYDEDRSFDDAVIVSVNGSAIYRNNFCAICHGVKNAIRWQLDVLECHEKLESLRLAFTDMRKYIMRNCSLLSVKPEGLPLTSRLIPCQKDIVSSCIDRTTATDIIAGCENGPFMPYTDPENYYSVYKNVLCYHCNGGDEDIARMCSDMSHLIDKSGVKPLIKLMNGKGSSDITNQGGACGESKIMDYTTNECRLLLCPPFEAAWQGVCQPIASPVRLTVKIRTVYWTNQSITIDQPISLYNGSIKQHYGRQLEDRFKPLGCPGSSATVTMETEPATNKLLYILAETSIGTDDKNCSIRQISREIRNKGSLSVPWLVNGEMLKMDGHYSFFRMDAIWKPNEDQTLLMARHVLHISRYVIDEFIVCPYVVIDIATYNQVFGSTADTSTADGTNRTTTLSKTTVTVAGSYVLSESQVAVCVDSYSPLSNTNNAIRVLLINRPVSFLPCFVTMVLLAYMN